MYVCMLDEKLCVSVSVCLCPHTYVSDRHIHACMHAFVSDTYIHMYVHTCMYIHTHVCTWIQR